MEAGGEVLRARLAARTPRRIEVPGAVRAAVAVLLAPGAAGAELLLIRRAERERDPWSGHMALPGGRRDPGDVDLLDTARRETREETGVELPLEAWLGELDDLHPSSPILPSIVVRPFVFALPARPLVRPNHEVAGHLWMPLAELRLARVEGEVLHRGRALRVPAYRVGQGLVWGLTQRILEPFLELEPGPGGSA
jgi:8-oxo-dGTP pyrophosphatase MutT (NUDIX family)